MANREACEVYIEQEIESGLEEGKTPYAIGKELSDWVAKMFEVRISPNTLKMRAYRKQDDLDTNVPNDNPMKKQTKPEVKKQLDEFVSAVKKDEITDDDAKKIADAIADKITNGTFAKRVGTKLATAVKKVNKERKEVTVRKTDNYQRLWKHVKDAANGLQIMADGAIPKPENEEEAEALKGTLMALPNLCLQTARMGVNLMEIHESLNKGEPINEKKYIDI
jgi:hypothetical protein